MIDTQPEGSAAATGKSPSPTLDKNSKSHNGWPRTAIGAAVVAAAALCIASAWIVHQATTKHQMTRALSGRVHLVVVHVTAGDIHLVNGGGPAELRSTARYIFSKPRVTTSVASGVLSVRSKCGNWWLHDCSTNIHLSVPPGAAVDADTDHGQITSEGLVSGQVRADASGKVRLRLANDPNLIVARSRHGDVSIRLPRAPYIVDATAAFDQKHIGIPHNDAAPRTIEATARHGEVKIQATPNKEQP